MYTNNRVDNMIREGTVDKVYPARHSVRVTFEDRGGMVSAELPVITNFASKNKTYALPDVGERVAVIGASNDYTSGSGYVIGSLYTGSNLPTVNDKDVAQIKFSDNTTVTYNRREHVFEVTFSDGSTVKHEGKSGDLTMNVKGNITINGDKRLAIDIKGRIDITAARDIIMQGSNIRLN